MEHLLVQWSRRFPDWLRIAMLGFRSGEGISSERMWTYLWLSFNWAPVGLFLLLLLVLVLLLFGLDAREEWNAGSCGWAYVGVWD